MEEDNRIITDYYGGLNAYLCEDCGNLTYCEMDEEVSECRFCNSKNVLRNISVYDLDEFGNELVNEEQDYTCENCYEEFTSIEMENIKCPHCGYVHESLDPIDPADREPDWIPSDDECEDIFDN